MSNKILLTAFKPFDGKAKNASEEIGKTLAAEFSDKVDLLVLDVGEGAENQLSRGLSSHPQGVLMTGEDSALRFHHFRIEDRAYNPQQQVNLLPQGRVAIRLPWARSASSSIAKEARSAVGANGPIEILDDLTTRLFGTFWCNRIYYQAMEWGNAQNRPVLFVHVGSSGIKETKVAPLRRILNLMIEKTRHLQ